MPFRKPAEKRHLYYDYFIFILLLLHATRAQPVNHTCLEMGKKSCRVELKSSQSAAKLSSGAWRRWEKFKLFKMTRESHKSATQKLHTSTSHWGWHIGADMRHLSHSISYWIWTTGTKPRIYCLSRGRINRMRHEYSSSVIEISQIFHSIRRWTVLLSISISRLPFAALESYNKEKKKSDRMWQFTASFVIERRSSVGWQLSDDRNIDVKRGFSNKIYGHSAEVERKNWVSNFGPLHAYWLFLFCSGKRSQWLEVWNVMKHERENWIFLNSIRGRETTKTQRFLHFIHFTLHSLQLLWFFPLLLFFSDSLHIILTKSRILKKKDSKMLCNYRLLPSVLFFLHLLEHEVRKNWVLCFFPPLSISGGGAARAHSSSFFYPRVYFKI